MSTENHNLVEEGLDNSPNQTEAPSAVSEGAPNNNQDQSTSQTEASSAISGETLEANNANNDTVTTTDKNGNTDETNVDELTVDEKNNGDVDVGDITATNVGESVNTAEGSGFNEVESTVEPETNTVSNEPDSNVVDEGDVSGVEPKTDTLAEDSVSAPASEQSAVEPKSDSAVDVVEESKVEPNGATVDKDNSDNVDSTAAVDSNVEDDTIASNIVEPSIPNNEEDDEYVNANVDAIGGEDTVSPVVSSDDVTDDESENEDDVENDDGTSCPPLTSVSDEANSTTSSADGVLSYILSKLRYLWTYIKYIYAKYY